MSKRKPAVLLGDIRNAIDKIDRYVAGMDHDVFLTDDKTVDAVVRSLHTSETMSASRGKLQALAVLG